MLRLLMVRMSYIAIINFEYNYEHNNNIQHKNNINTIISRGTHLLLHYSISRQAFPSCIKKL